MVGVGLGQFQNASRRANASDFLTSTVQSLVYPAANRVGTALSWTGDFFLGLRDAARLKKENETLRLQLAALDVYAIELVERDVQIQQLRDMLQMEPMPDRTLISGRIIDYAIHENRITIDKGSDDGVTPLLPVISPQGLVGRVEVVDRRTSQILLITAPSLQIGAKVQRAVPVAGLIRGSTPNQLILEVVDRSVVDVGDPVVTSGYSSVIPPGIPIGEVAEVPPTDDYNNRRIKVFPSLRLGLNQEVIVVK